MLPLMERGTRGASWRCCERYLVLDLLHAAEHARVDGSADQQIGDFHRNGLLLVARQIARAAHTGLGDAITAVEKKPG
ncbi:hypothetical protein G6052_04610 [Stenotrophomonas maltophilia]|nr:hypothetical protein G6052_04610 [Stenotrophomonas maltophilia]